MNKNYNLRKVGEPLNSKSLDWPTVCEEIKKNWVMIFLKVG